MRLRALATAVTAAATVVALAGCGSSSSPQAQPTQPAATYATPTTPPPCARVSAAPVTKTWPAGVPSDVPMPPGMKVEQTQTTTTGIHVVRFSTPTSLRESVLFVVQALPKAGFVLGRGDAEAAEADAPFVHGDVRGTMRMAAVSQCQTLWLLATVKTTSQPGTTPLLPTRSPSSSPSPLPFG